jgi:hypothetical protein
MAGAMLGKRKIDGEVCLEFLAGFWWNCQLLLI